jgi:uncharacterized membrane protein
MVDERQLVRGLGWFSLGLGLAQVMSPGGVARLIGVRDEPDNRATMFMVGLREITAGVGILTQRRPTGWLWARVAGDAMDLALLNTALNSPKNNRERVTMALLSVVGITVADLNASQKASNLPETSSSARSNPGASTSENIIRNVNGKTNGKVQEDRGMKVKKTIIVSCSPEEIYQYWHNFENLPNFMKHLESVQTTGEKRSHWKTKGPAGSTIEWDAEVVEDQPNKLISWRSLPGAQVDNSGSVRLEQATGGRGTLVAVEMEYDPPAGAVGATVAKLFGEAPDQQVQDDLRAFKQVMETGEIVVSDATYHGHPHPAQPPAMNEARA